MSALDPNGQFVWLRFSARTTTKQEFEFSMESSSCRRGDQIDLDTVRDMATDIIGEADHLGGDLELNSVHQVFVVETLSRQGVPDSELEEIRILAKRVRLDGERGFGDKLPWYNQN